MFVPVLFIESPLQIAMVLGIILVLFGPNKLPELAKQLGTAVRELRKATSDVARSFSTDFEPDAEPYRDNSSSYGTVDYGYRAPDYTAPPDLTDYTIAGLPPNDQAAYGYGDQEVENAYAFGEAGAPAADGPSAGAPAAADVAAPAEGAPQPAPADGPAAPAAS